MMMGEACQSWLSAKSLVVIVGFTYKSIKYLLSSVVTKYGKSKIIVHIPLVQDQMMIGN